MQLTERRRTRRRVEDELGDRGAGRADVRRLSFSGGRVDGQASQDGDACRASSLDSNASSDVVALRAHWRLSFASEREHVTHEEVLLPIVRRAVALAYVAALQARTWRC
jgi:hypothetical protein